MTKRYRPRGSGGDKKRTSLALAAPAPNATPPQGRVVARPSITRWSPYAEYVDLTWSQVVSFVRSANFGQTEQAADLWCRMRASDDHVTSVVESRISATSGARWELNPGQGEETLAKRAADESQRMLESLPNLEQSKADLLEAVFIGWSALEIIWEPRGDWWWPVDLIWIHPRRFRFDDDFRLFLYDDGQAALQAKDAGYADALISARSGQGVQLVPNKYVVHMPRTLPTYPSAAGLMHSLIRPWWVKSWVTKYWLSGAEVAGNPRYWGLVPEQADDAVMDEMADGLEDLAGDGVGVFRQGSSVSVQAPLAQGSGSVWEALSKRCDAAISKAVLGSTLNVEVGDSGGNRSLGESQGDITIAPRVTRDARAMWRTLERDLITPFLRFNRHHFGGRMPAIPRGESIHYEESPNIDELVVTHGRVAVDELRTSRGLPPKGAEGGGDQVIAIAPDMGTALPSEPTTTPVPDAAEAANVEKAADAALNGAQVESLLEIVSRVASGQIPRETGINLITAAFPLTREQAEQIMGPVGAGFVPTPEPGAEPAATAVASVEAPAARPLRSSPPWETALKLALQTTGSDATQTSTPSPTTRSGNGQ